jgi:hypothetical protein
LGEGSDSSWEQKVVGTQYWSQKLDWKKSTIEESVKSDSKLMSFGMLLLANFSEFMENPSNEEEGGGHEAEVTACGSRGRAG